MFARLLCTVVLLLALTPAGAAPPGASVLPAAPVPEPLALLLVLVALLIMGSGRFTPPRTRLFT